MKRSINKKLSDKHQASSKINLKEISGAAKLISISYISKKRKPILLSFLLLLVLSDVYAINPFSLLKPSYTMAPSQFGGMDVYYLCENQTETNYSANVYLNILHNKRDIDVIVCLKNNNQSGSFPQKIGICFPGITENHMVVKSMDLPDNESDIKYISEDSPIKRNIDGKISVTLDPITGTEYIEIDTRRIPNFNGGIEFFWPNGVKKSSMFNFKISLPFGAPSSHYYFKDFQKIDSYELQVMTPNRYTMDASNPQWTKFFIVGEHELYTFNISQNDFRADFSHYNAESYENFITLVSSLLLGIFLSQILSNER